jgi:Tol biopolymer transport system component
LAGLPGDVTTRIVFSVSCIQRSSRIAFEREGDIFLALVGSGTVNVTNHPAADVSPALSPDRSRIVFSSNRDDPSGNPSDLYVVNVDGSGLVRLTNSAGGDWVGSQAWSPDESKIVFTSYRDDPNGEIYVMNADGSGVVRLTRDGASDINPAWSPDGSSIAFCSNRVSEWQFDIYRMSASGGSSVKVASDGCDPAWSPDGSKIAYITGTDPDMSIPDLAVIGVDGAGFVQLHPFSISFTDRSSRPSWSPDGSWIAFTRDWDSTVVIIPFDGENFGASIDLRRGASPSWR